MLIKVKVHDSAFKIFNIDMNSTLEDLLMLIFDKLEIINGQEQFCLVEIGEEISILDNSEKVSDVFDFQLLDLDNNIKIIKFEHCFINPNLQLTEDEVSQWCQDYIYKFRHTQQFICTPIIISYAALIFQLQNGNFSQNKINRTDLQNILPNYCFDLDYLTELETHIQQKYQKLPQMSQQQIEQKINETFGNCNELSQTFQLKMISINGHPKNKHITLLINHSNIQIQTESQLHIFTISYKMLKSIVMEDDTLIIETTGDLGQIQLYKNNATFIFQILTGYKRQFDKDHENSEDSDTTSNIYEIE